MSAENLQTVIVPKAVAKTRAAATKAARRHANRIYTSRETSVSWRFRQRPETDFARGSFRTKKLPDGISLVYGKLKNPRRFEPSEPTMTAEIRWMWKVEKTIGKAKTLYGLAALAREVDAHSFESPTVEDHLVHAVAKRARALRGPVRRGTGMVADRRAFEAMVEHATGPQVELFAENPGARVRRLQNPTRMPDPGPCALLGDTLEWKWKNGRSEHLWDDKGKKWLFLWSPRYKAIVAIRNPKGMKKLPKVSRSGGGAKMFERFAARKANATHEIEIPAVALKKLGRAEHIVYRSDKWSSNGKPTDYIHDFKSGVNIFCGPTLKDPQVFLCFGGKLTCTERGLVF